MRTTLTTLGLVSCLCFGMLLASGCSDRASHISAEEGSGTGKWEYAELIWYFRYSLKAEKYIPYCQWEGPGDDECEAFTFDAFAKEMNFDIKVANSTAILNGIGNDGWELVTHTRFPTNNFDHHVYTFKRRK